MTRLTLRGLLARLAGDQRELLDCILDSAKEGGDRVYLVGGPVRDWLLDQPLKDLDLCVAGADLGAAENLARRSAPETAKVVVHSRFGTARIESGTCHVDLATTRSESYKSPGALPLPKAADLSTDLQRRDFTVNAMAFPLSAGARDGGRGVVDPFGGMSDLETRQLRILHPASFHDDPTRALRAARFLARFARRLEKNSRNSLHLALRDGALAEVRGARLRREFEKLGSDAMAGAQLHRALAKLDEWHVLSGLEPGLGVPTSARSALKRLGVGFRAPPWEFRNLVPWRALARVWLGFLSKTQAKGALARLAIGGKPAAEVIEFRESYKRKLRELTRGKGRGHADRVLSPLSEESLLALVCVAEPKERHRIVRFSREDRHRILPVTGRDLVEAGLAGQQVGAALERLRGLFLDGQLRNASDALALARELPGSRS